MIESGETGPLERLNMRRHLIIAALLCTPAAAQRPTPEEQRRTLDTARDTAIHYTNKLPDFICTEQVQRTDRTSPAMLDIRSPSSFRRASMRLH